MISKIAAPSVAGTVKPGVYTTEFLLTVALNAIAILDAKQVWTLFPPRYAPLVMGVVTSAYALSRGWAKSG